MHPRNLIFLAAMALTGCASQQLQFTSTRQMSSEPDIYIQQVMDNLARIASDPTALPYFNTLDSGVPQVTDKATLGGFIQFPAQTIVKQLHEQRGGQLGPLTGERDVNVNWTIKPVNDEGRLRAMQGLYLWVLGRLDPADLCDFETRIGGFYIGANGKINFSFGQVEQGWFQCGSWRDKPKDAQYWVHHHGSFYWVLPGHERALTDLSLRVLRIALVAKRTKTVVRTYYNVEGRVAQTESSVEAVEKIVPSGTVKRPALHASADKRIREILANYSGEFVEIMRKYPKLFHRIITMCDQQTSQLAGKSEQDLFKSKLTDPVSLSLLRRNEEIKRVIKEKISVEAKEREKQKKAAETELATAVFTLNNTVTDTLRPELAKKVEQATAKLQAVQGAIKAAEPVDVQAKTQLDEIDEDVEKLLDSSPDPELNIDTFTNTEISPGLITGAPH